MTDVGKFIGVYKQVFDNAFLLIYLLLQFYTHNENIIDKFEHQYRLRTMGLDQVVLTTSRSWFGK